MTLLTYHFHGILNFLFLFKLYLYNSFYLSCIYTFLYVHRIIVHIPLNNYIMLINFSLIIIVLSILKQIDHEMSYLLTLFLCLYISTWYTSMFSFHIFYRSITRN